MPRHYLSGIYLRHPLPCLRLISNSLSGSTPLVSGISGLAYLGMLIGVFLGAALVIAHTKTRFAQITKANNGVVIPEQRIPLMILGGCLLPIGLFVYAWTSDPDIHWTG